ncbi:hypothetical protein RN001_014589 [Aquatica leii]|uniref:Major facilitator superfamily (MFS) profile domain-containing protein n=1 Tax=Aquatica leii TaxID=1421715 RepID=A0AAN7NUP8_9COLE|nr:hypothetical protein RN001_014589 [Aquatica leii]
MSLNLEYNVRCKTGCLEKSNWSFDQIKEFSADNSSGFCAYKLYDYRKFCNLSFEEAKDIISTFEHPVESKKCNDVLMTHYLFPYTYKHQIDELCARETHVMPVINVIAEFFGLSATLVLGDIYGRKPVIIYSQLVYIVCNLIRRFPIEPITWYLIIFLAKASMTSAINASLILFLEAIHFEERPLGITLISLGTSLGCVFKGLFYRFDKSWEFYQELINCFLVVPLFSQWLLWESPHWLLCNLRWVELEDLLKQIDRRGHADLSDEIEEKLSETKTSAKIIFSTLKKPIFRNRIFCNMILYSISSFLYSMQINHVLYESKCENMLYFMISITLIATIVIIPRVLPTFSRPMSMCLTFLVIALQHTAATIYNLDESWKYFAICLSVLTTEMTIMLNELLIVEKFPTKVRVTSMNLCKICAVIFVSFTNGACRITHLESNIKNYEDFIYLIMALIGACVCLFIKATNINMLPDTEVEAILDL